MSKKLSAKLAREACERFPTLPDRAVARFILENNDGVYESLEQARSSVRYARGHNGKKARKNNKAVVSADRVSRMPTSWRKIREPYNLPAGCWLVLSDVHVPYHEEKAIGAAIQWGQLNKVDGIFLNGDLFDCASVGFWPTARRDFARVSGS